MRKNLSISLNEHHEGLIVRLVESGRYQGASDVVRSALRLLEHEEALLDAELREALARGMDDVREGRVSRIDDPDALAADIKRRGRKRLQQSE